ncbi:MAG: prepilin-type N-terminal cleavage/methylation domain-containing protein, partial [Betaproteobacteria bacterium]|nr:prepilin-type N-terminal cleavage/methylation domain-containing protein [Betaproteobacteria bacterium]
MKASTKQGRGFTLVEIAIVLVIIGLLLGGILKGQELIDTAKVRAIADRQSALKIAWFSFVDRYGAIPGDWDRANFHLKGVKESNGDGIIDVNESPL